MIYVTDPADDTLLFITESLKKKFGIEEDVIGKTCYKVLQQGVNERCESCPCKQLEQEPDKTVVWDEYHLHTDSYYRNTDRYIDWYDGRKVHIQYVADLTDEKRVRIHIEQRDRLLYAMNRSAFILLNSDIDSLADDLLRSMNFIGHTVSVNRICIWKNHTVEDELYCSRVFEWTDFPPPQPADTELTQNVSYTKTIPGWEDILSNGNHIKSIVRDLSSVEQAQLLPQGILSLLVVPIHVKDHFWGFVGFDACQVEKEFTDNEEEMLRSISLQFVHTWLRVEMVEEIASADRRLRLMLDTSPICCQIWDRNFNIIECNEAAVRLYGFKNKKEYIENFATQCSPEYQPDGERSDEKAVRFVNKAFEEGRSVFEWVHRIPSDGSLMPAEIILVRLEYQEDYVVVGYTQDLRPRIKMMQKIESALFDAQEANNAKTEFLSRMSHEMLTPMNVIMGLTQVLTMNLETSVNIPKAKRCLTEIDTASQQLLGLINNLLDLSAGSSEEAGQEELQLDLASFSFEAMFHSALMAIGSAVNQKGISLSFSIDPSIPLSLIGDERRLLQVLGFLLENAVKFTPEKGKIHAMVRVFNEDSEAVILLVEITDTGVGIAKEEQRRIFNVFEQADGSITRKHGGTGLGLPVLKKIVEMMGGTIWVESELDKGSKFSVTCPLRKVC